MLDSDSLLGGLLGLLWQKDGLDVRQHTALSDGHSAEEFVELLIVTHRQLEMAGNDAGLLVVAGGVSSQLQDLSRQILKHGSQVDWSTSTDTMSIVAFAEESVNTADGELKPGTGRPGLGLGSRFTSGLTSSRHVQLLYVVMQLNNVLNPLVGLYVPNKVSAHWPFAT